MLWIEKYRPQALGEVVGQEPVVRHLHRFAAERSVPHLLVTGPHGTGKSAAIGCLAQALYGDGWEGNTTVLDSTDIFLQGKSSLAADERFAHLFRKDEGLAANFKRIVRWYASMRPLEAEFKLFVLEGAHSLPHEIQQSLRRTLERYSATCRFILCTTNQSAIIPAISSRCLPLTFSSVDGPAILRTLMGILEGGPRKTGETPGGGRADRPCLGRRPAEGDHAPPAPRRVGEGSRYRGGRDLGDRGDRPPGREIHAGP